MKKFLMCYPQNFVVNYEINAWMKDNIGTVNNAQAVEQWSELYKQLISAGNSIELMKNQTFHVPDLVFTANAAIKVGKNVLISHFANKERQPESLIYQDFFETLGYKVDMSCIDSDIYFEGAGDMLLHQQTNTYVLAYGFRTQEKAKELIQNFFNKNNCDSALLQVELVDSRFYHLDTCYCPLDNGDVLYFPHAFSSDSQKSLSKLLGNKLIAVSEEDAINFACNAVSVDKFVYLNKASASLLKILLDRGLIVVETPLSEFLKAGGSAKCLTMEI